MSCGNNNRRQPGRSCADKCPSFHVDRVYKGLHCRRSSINNFDKVSHVNCGGLNPSTVHKVLETVFEFVWWLALGEEVHFQVTFTYWVGTSFNVLTDFNGYSCQFVTTNTTENSEQVFFQFSEQLQ